MADERPLGEAVSVQERRISRWYLRVPLKWLIFGAVTFFVLFPHPRQFARHLSHLNNLDRMVQPDAPELSAWDDQLRERLAQKAEAQAKEANADDSPSPPGLSPRQAQREVERFVYKKVKYDWDWEVWGSADYMPTVAEMFAKAAERADGQIREDCDGRAVIAASLMSRLGYQASLVTDLRHVWVSTPQGEWMGPGGKKTVISTPQGNRLDIRTAWQNLPVSLSYGMSVFPLLREFIILLTAYLLLVHRRMSRPAAALGGLLLVQGLLFMRCGVLLPRSVPGFSASWPAVVGCLHLLAGCTVLCVSSHRARLAG